MSDINLPLSWIRCVLVIAQAREGHDATREMSICSNRFTASSNSSASRSAVLSRDQRQTATGIFQPTMSRLSSLASVDGYNPSGPIQANRQNIRRGG
jgi:hypothetical protein